MMGRSFSSCWMKENERLRLPRSKRDRLIYGGGLDRVWEWVGLGMDGFWAGGLLRPNGNGYWAIGL